MIVSFGIVGSLKFIAVILLLSCTSGASIVTSTSGVPQRAHSGVSDTVTSLFTVVPLGTVSRAVTWYTIVTDCHIRRSISLISTCHAPFVHPVAVELSVPG